MPPSRKSTTSHSSSRSHSSRSSRSSHSSRSSSRSHSSRSYSSHSSRSYSKGSGTFGGYSGNRSHRASTSRGSSTRLAPPPRKKRSNQPRGYKGAVAATMLRSAVHDYYYYPTGWTDEETGTFYESGYYDEAGKHYDQVTIRNGAEYETMLACEYCGTNIKLKWTEGAIPSCPNCGALLREMTENSVVEDILKDQPVSTGTKKMNLKPIYIGIFFMTIIMVMPFLRIFLSTFIRELNKNLYDINSTTTTSTYYAEEDDGRSIYVNEIGRECYWDDENEYYYDEASDCYFFFNDETDTPEWQYWYEGISSDFGDYGWMFYDYDEEQWYIEDSGEWIILPDSYDTSILWHFDEMGTGKYNGQNSIYVDSIDRTCEWIPDEEAYYDEETDCFFLYNDYVDPPVWQYWYDDISSDYTGYGWMEYNEDEGQWYIETEDGWIELPDSYSADALWHLD